MAPLRDVDEIALEGSDFILADRLLPRLVVNGGDAGLGRPGERASRIIGNNLAIAGK